MTNFQAFYESFNPIHRKKPNEPGRFTKLPSQRVNRLLLISSATVEFDVGP